MFEEGIYWSGKKHSKEELEQRTIALLHMLAEFTGSILEFCFDDIMLAHNVALLCAHTDLTSNNIITLWMCALCKESPHSGRPNELKAAFHFLEWLFEAHWGEIQQFFNYPPIQHYITTNEAYRIQCQNLGLET